MKRNSDIIYKHWQNKCEISIKTNKQYDEIFKAAQDVQQNKPNLQAKYILNKKLVESQGQKLSQVKLLQNVTDEDLRSIQVVTENIKQNIKSTDLKLN